MSLTLNEIKKDLYKSKVNAKFSHYCAGKLYYTVALQNGEVYQFPISTTEQVEYKLLPILRNIVPVVMQLSSDLGQTPFNAEIKAAELNRWIAKAYEKGDFICINKAPESVETNDELSNLAGTV